MNKYIQYKVDTYFTPFSLVFKYILSNKKDKKTIMCLLTIE